MAEFRSDVNYDELNLTPSLISKDSPLLKDKMTSSFEFDSLNERASVTETKLADGAVGTSALGTGNIDTAQIADGAITTDKLEDDAVTSSKIAGSAVGETDINDSAVTADKIAGSAVTNTKILSVEWTKGLGGTASFGGTTNTYGRIEVQDEAGGTTHSFGSAGFLVDGTAVTIDDNSGTTRVTYGTQVAKTVIMPTSEGYRALYCVESPSVWFMDFVSSINDLDPLFVEVTEPPYKFIQCVDGGYQVWGRRKDLSDLRFEEKTKEEYEANEKFYRKANII